jgi:hypothetical protein
LKKRVARDDVSGGLSKATSFSAVEYKESAKSYDERVRLLDETPYRLCSEHPKHSDVSEVHAKLWIIARTLASGIERKVSLAKVEKQFFGHGAQLDRLMGQLRAIVEPLSPENLKVIVTIHGQTVKTLRALAGDRSARSFVSKYMYFHNSAVPIYDSRANKALRGLIRMTDDLKTFSVSDSDDKKYARFAMRFLKLYALVESERLRPNVKSLDHYLLSVDSKLSAT